MHTTQDVYQPRGQFKNAKVAFCIHNIAFQGRFWPESFKDMALPPSAMQKLGFKDGYSKVRVCVSVCVSLQRGGRGREEKVW